jgi:hypothetical protein
MCRRISLIFALLSFASLGHAEKARKPVPPQPAASYPFHDTHAQVTIAAEPGDTKQTRPDTRVDYYAHDMLPIRVIVTNDSDKPITLDDARIDFIASDNSKVLAATTDDLNRRLFELKQTKPVKIPLVPITVHHKPIDTKILADDTDFGFKTTTIAPHTTIAGYLYYDTEGLPDPPLKNAALEVRKVRWKLDNTAVLGDALDTFEIPLAAADTKK